MCDASKDHEGDMVAFAVLVMRTARSSARSVTGWAVPEIIACTPLIMYMSRCSDRFE